MAFSADRPPRAPNRFCFFHKQSHDERFCVAAERCARRNPATFTLPVLEDANSIQIALREDMRLVLSHQIEHKTTGLLLYALQPASGNLRRAASMPITTTSSSNHATPPSLH